MTKQTFALRYDIQAEPGPWTREQLGTMGGTDAVIIQSLVFPEDGTFSLATFTNDGRTGGPVEATDIFRAWIAQAAGLIDSGALPHWQEAICAEALDHVRRLMGVRTVMRDDAPAGKPPGPEPSGR